MASDRRISSAQRGLVLGALLLNAGVATLFAFEGASLALIVLLPIAALPVVGLVTQHDPALFRLSMVVVGVVYLAVAAIFLFFGGAAFAPAGLLLLAAAFGPADRPGRSRTRRTIALCPAAALTFLVVLLILDTLD